MHLKRPLRSLAFGAGANARNVQNTNIESTFEQIAYTQVHNYFDFRVLRENRRVVKDADGTEDRREELETGFVLSRVNPNI